MIAFEDVAARLSMLGIDVTEEQRGAVEYAVGLAFERLTAAINRTEIPPTMKSTFIDVAAGIYLQNKRTAEMLTAENDSGIAAERVIKHISEGDVSIEYDTTASTGASNIDVLIEQLINPPLKVIIKHRRLAR